MAAAAGQRLTAAASSGRSKRRGVSVALSAGAGCGKTFVLTERFLRALEPDQRRRRRHRAAGPVDGHHLYRAGGAGDARPHPQGLPPAAPATPPKSRSNTGSAWSASSTRRGSAPSTRSAASLLRAHAVEAGRRSPLPSPRPGPGRHAALRADRPPTPPPPGRAATRRCSNWWCSSAWRGLRDMVRQLLAGGRKSTGPNGAARRSEGLLARWERYWRDEALPRAAERIARSPQAAEVLGILRDSRPRIRSMRQRCGSDCWPRATCRRWPQALRQMSGDLGGDPRKRQGAGRRRKKAWASEEIYEPSATPPQAPRSDRRRAASAWPSTPRPPGRRRSGPAAAGGRRRRGRRLRSREAELAALDFNDLLIRARDLLAGPHGDGLAQAAGRPDQAAAGR